MDDQRMTFGRNGELPLRSYPSSIWLGRLRRCRTSRAA
jgi:hypothetical protein